MLTRGTVPSRPELFALLGQELAASPDEIWQRVREGDPAALADLAKVYTPRLDHYLHAGLGIEHAKVRERITAATIAQAAAKVRTGSLEGAEMRLYRAVRRAAIGTNAIPDKTALPAAGPKSLTRCLGLLATNIRSAIARFQQESPGAPDVLAFAAHVAEASAASPVWFAEPDFLPRAARANAICETIIDSASEGAPEPLTPLELWARRDDVTQAFDRVWMALPTATREARTLWGLNVAVSDIALILDARVAQADTALLQLLAITTAFNMLIGRKVETDTFEAEMLSQLGHFAEEHR
jgi:hypothetical protein